MTNPGQKIDNRYQILNPLGKGMSGEVHLVEDEGHRLALKILNPLQINVSRTEALESFKREFRVLKELNHPNIARILDFGYDDKIRRYYFTSEFVNGCDLHKACEHQPLSAVENLLAQVLRALNYLHSRGVYHFDIKPQNILVGFENGLPTQVKLIDFGLSGLAAPGKKVGTPSYMVPEVILGGILDGRADLYSFGVLIYKALTGENPFAAKTLQATLDNQVQLIPRPPTSLKRDLPRYWDHIIGRLLEKDPVQRYSQAALVLRDLNFLSGKKFDVETEDTKLSYLPERGVLIGREEAWNQYSRIFGDVFVVQKEAKARLLIIEGGAGSGKTRFLAEIKHSAQLQGVAVREWQRFQSQAENPEALVLLVDDPELSPDEINTLMQQRVAQRLLVIWTTESAPANWTVSDVIRLQNYSPAQVRQYLEAVTGLSRTPDRLIAAVYERTHGNPLLVTEFVKALITHGLLFDASGKWDAATFEDVRIDFDAIQLPASLDEYLRRKLCAVRADHLHILKCLAVHGDALSPDELGRIFSGPGLQEDLFSLMQNELLELSSAGTYVLKNPLLAKLAVKMCADEERLDWHEKLAQAFAGNPDAIACLRHVAFSRDKAKARQALCRLGELHSDAAEHDKAIEAFRLWLERASVADAGYSQNHLRLVRNLAAARRLPEARTEAEQALSRGGSPDQVLAALNELSAIHFKFCDLEPSVDHVAAVQGLIAHARDLLPAAERQKFWQIVFDNHEAHAYSLSGENDAAARIYQQTHALWLHTLSPEDQAQVANNRLPHLHLLRDQYDEAARVCSEMLKTFEQAGDKYQTALQYYQLGSIHYKVLAGSKPAEADKTAALCRHAFEQCEYFARMIKNQPLLLRALNALGMLAVNGKYGVDAVKTFGRALSVARKIGELEMAGLISYNIATQHKKQAQLKEAYSYVVYAINTFESLTKRSEYTNTILYISYLLLAEIQVRLADVSGARAAVARADAIGLNPAAAKSRESVKFLVLARICFAEADFSQGEVWLNQAALQAVTPEQKDEVAHYKKSAEYRTLRAQADGLSESDLAQAAEQLPNLEALIASQKEVITFFCSVRVLEHVVDVLELAFYCIQRLAKADGVGIFLRATDGEVQPLVLCGSQRWREIVKDDFMNRWSEASGSLCHETLKSAGEATVSGLWGVCLPHPDGARSILCWRAANPSPLSAETLTLVDMVLRHMLHLLPKLSAPAFSREML